jgi:hypothetical protein
MYMERPGTLKKRRKHLCKRKTLRKPHHICTDPWKESTKEKVTKRETMWEIK